MEEEKTIITGLTKDLLTQIGFHVTVEVTEQDGLVNIHLKTDEDASLLIGKHAHMLASLQRVLSAMLYNKFQKKVDVLLDINDYRAVQKDRLIGIADNIAQRVINEKRPAQLRSFSAYERRIIHEHIANNYLTLTSESEGDDRDRVLVISQKPE